MLAGAGWYNGLGFLLGTAQHMVSFEIFVKSMPPSLSELKVLPSFCFAFKIPDDVTVTIIYVLDLDENCWDLSRYIFVTYFLANKWSVVNSIFRSLLRISSRKLGLVEVSIHSKWLERFFFAGLK